MRSLRRKQGMGEDAETLKRSRSRTSLRQKMSYYAPQRSGGLWQNFVRDYQYAAVSLSSGGILVMLTLSTGVTPAPTAEQRQHVYGPALPV